MNWMWAIAVFVGGGLGSTCRFGISMVFKGLDAAWLPLATLTSNVLSTLLLGLLLMRISSTTSPLLFFFATVGFCGGFSTFSTFSLETMQLMRNGQLLWATLNVVVSVLLCLTVLYACYKTMR